VKLEVFNGFSEVTVRWWEHAGIVQNLCMFLCYVQVKEGNESVIKGLWSRRENCEESCAC
jgi:hypothetical protein